MAFALTMDKKDMMVFDTTQETMWTLNMDRKLDPRALALRCRTWCR
jgi:hypothetical protein